MERALVVVDDTDAHRELLREAGGLAHDTGADLVLFSWMTQSEYEENADAMASVERIERTTYSDSDALDGVRAFLREFAADVAADLDLAGEDLAFETAAVVAERDELADHVLEAAERFECDHVFVVGRRRSPAGKMLFGDVAQQVVLNSEYPVTVTVE